MIGKQFDEEISWLHRLGRKQIEAGYYVPINGGRFVTLALEKPMIHPVMRSHFFAFFCIPCKFDLSHVIYSRVRVCRIP